MKFSFRPSAIFTWFLSCAFLGGLILSLIAPKSIAWYFEPPVEIGINCRPAAEWAMNALLKSQLIGVGLGILVGGLLVFWLLKREKSKGIDPLK